MSTPKIDHTVLNNSFDMVLHLIGEVMAGRRGSRERFLETFNGYLDTPYSELAKTVPGLEDKILIFRLAYDVAGPGTTAEQGAEFSARFARVMSGHGAKDWQLNELHGLFVKHHGDWFIEQYNARLAA